MDPQNPTPMIVTCTCPRVAADSPAIAFQETRYGSGKRVANPTKDPTKARCTVCRELVSVSTPEKK